MFGARFFFLLHNILWLFSLLLCVWPIPKQPFFTKKKKQKEWQSKKIGAVFRVNSQRKRENPFKIVVFSGIRKRFAHFTYMKRFLFFLFLYSLCVFSSSRRTAIEAAHAYIIQWKHTHLMENLHTPHASRIVTQTVLPFSTLALGGRTVRYMGERDSVFLHVEMCVEKSKLITNCFNHTYTCKKQKLLSN